MSNSIDGFDNNDHTVLDFVIEWLDGEIRTYPKVGGSEERNQLLYLYSDYYCQNLVVTIPLNNVRTIGFTV